MKIYLIILSFVFLTLMYFGFLGPWLISARSDEMVWLGILLFVGIYVPYLIYFGKWIVKKIQQKMEENNEN